MWTCTGDLCSSRIHFRYFCRSYTTSHTAQSQCLRSSVWYSRLRDVFCGRAEIVDRDSLLREAGPRQSTAPGSSGRREVRTEGGREGGRSESQEGGQRRAALAGRTLGRGRRRRPLRRRCTRNGRGQVSVQKQSTSFAVGMIVDTAKGLVSAGAAWSCR